MKKTLLVLPLLFCAAPALGQPAPLPRELTDPATADRIADAVQGLSQALLDVRVGGIEAALEGRRATAQERSRTVGDMARQEDPQFDSKYRRSMANVRPMMRQSMDALATALPQMMDGLAQARQAIERAVANLPDPTYPRR